jgi:hypothetical protein
MNNLPPIGTTNAMTRQPPLEPVKPEVASLLEVNQFISPMRSDSTHLAKHVCYVCEAKNCKKIVKGIEKVYRTCKCEKIFCGTHYPSVKHQCTFDFHAREKQRLTNQLSLEEENHKKRKVNSEFNHKPSENSSY